MSSVKIRSARRADWQSEKRLGDLMYVPARFAVNDAEIRELLTSHGTADLVTATPQGLLATLLPFIYDPSFGEHGRPARASRAQQRSVALRGAGRRW